MTRLSIALLAASFTLAATPHTAGPPWIAIEYPVNPYDNTTRGAFLVVNVYHHGTPTAFPVSGTAEGIVRGQRRSIPLQFKETSRTASFALAKQWPDSGTWTLVIGALQGPNDRVSAVIDLSAKGEVMQVNVPTRKQDGHTIPAAVNMQSIDQSLRERAADR